jgi:pre-mRNA-splicing factor CWC26
MSTKLDYLKKYMSSSSSGGGSGSGGRGGSGDLDHNVKKRKKVSSSSSSSNGRGMKVLDAEDEANQHTLRSVKSAHDAWDMLDNDDEPVVVEGLGSSDMPESKTQSHRAKLGSWEASAPRSRESGDQRQPSRRHDSDSDDGPPRRKPHVERPGSDSDSPPRRPAAGATRRHDSDDDEPPRRPAPEPARKRHDSDEEEPPRRPTAGQSRHDSDEDEPPRRAIAPASNSRRHDNDSDSDGPRRRPAARSSRHDSDDDEPPRRSAPNSAAVGRSSSNRRHDSDDDEPPRRPQEGRSDKDREPHSGRRPDGSRSPPRRLSDSRDDPRTRDRERERSRDRKGRGETFTRDSKDDERRDVRSNHSHRDHSGDERDHKSSNRDESRGKPKERAKVATTASGHSAGLQTSKQFGQKEREIHQSRSRDLDNADKSLTGENEETVYRDRRGRKLDMLNEMMRQQAQKEGKALKIAEVTQEWGTGTAQKREVAELATELEQIAQEPFARMADNARLEDYKKGVIRDGDPMAEYMMRQEAKKQKKHEKEQGKDVKSADAELQAPVKNKPSNKKPVYTGPAATPNRFHIRPGYRWDAIDRGNGFESKVLLRMSEKSNSKEDEYKWSVSDM